MAMFSWILSVTGLLATGTLAANLVLFLRSKDRRERFRDAVMLLLGVNPHIDDAVTEDEVLKELGISL